MDDDEIEEYKSGKCFIFGKSCIEMHLSYVPSTIDGHTGKAIEENPYFYYTIYALCGEKLFEGLRFNCFPLEEAVKQAFESVRKFYSEPEIKVT
jgi:hypothetical protein